MSFRQQTFLTFPFAFALTYFFGPSLILQTPPGVVSARWRASHRGPGCIDGLAGELFVLYLADEVPWWVGDTLPQVVEMLKTIIGRQAHGKI
jgi:hypothetical protein